MVGADQIVAAIKTHCKALTAKDKDLWLSIWAEDAFLEDPVGRDIFRGRDQLATIFWASIESLSPMKLWLERDTIVCGNEAMAFLNGVVTLNGKLHRVGPNLTDHFVFNEAGKITSMRSFWKYS